MLHDLKDQRIFPRFTEQDLQELCSYGEQIEAADKEIVQNEGELSRGLLVVLEGALRIFRRVGGAEELIAFHSKSQFAGDLNLLMKRPSACYIQACGPSKLLLLSSVAVRRIIADDSPTAERLLQALAARARQVDSHLIQEEKLASLGKMAAGLAHELNNPASAAKRAAKLMLEGVRETPLAMLKQETTYNEEERQHMRQFFETILNTTQPVEMDPLARSDLEQELCQILEEHNVPRADEIASTLAEYGIERPQLEKWISTTKKNLVKGFLWMETMVRLTALARDIESSTNRIADLVTALKEYSYMDQAKYQEVDVHKGIENTLKIMKHKLKRGVTVVREYSPDLPKICAYPGELNQVWTNLVDNAIDAMNGCGVLTIRTSHRKNCVVVEVADNGPGVPEQMQDLIFDQFFTTKPQGKGTGLGLDISRSIVRYRHGGCIHVRSKPGDTVFEVELPINPPKESEILAAVQEESLTGRA